MAQHYIQTFTAANGTLWTGLSFVQALGSSAAGYVARVQGNKGWCKSGLSNNKQIYKSTYLVGERDHKVKAVLTWKGTTNNREYGIGARVTSDGKYGYFFLAASEFGTPVARLIRRYNGAETEIAGPTAIPYMTEMLAGAEFSMEPTTTEESVRWVCKIDGNVVFDAEGDSAVRIEGGGAAGVMIGHTCTDDDVVI